MAPMYYKVTQMHGRQKKAKDRPLSLRIESQLKKRIESLSSKTGISSGEIVRRALLEALPEWETKGITLGHGL